MTAIPLNDAALEVAEKAYWTDYGDARHNLRAAIAAYLAADQASTEPRTEAKVIDLMAALKESLKRSARTTALARLAATLEAFPALRIGQLLINASAPATAFYVTDENLAKALDDYTRKWGR